MEILTDFTVLGVLLIYVLAVVWMILPFAVLGTKPRIDRGNELAGRTNELLSNISRLLLEQTEVLRRLEAFASAGEQKPEPLDQEPQPD